MLLQSVNAAADVIPGVPLSQKFSGYVGNTSLGEYVNQSDISYYSKILKQYEQNGYKDAEKDIEIKLSDIKNDNGKISLTSYQEKDNVFVWDKTMKTISFEVDIPESALYQMEAEYYVTGDSSNPAVRSIYIDGKTPFTEATNTVFQRMFVDEGEPVINTIGDETRPKQKETPAWRVTRFVDSTGMATLPFKFYLEKGKHTIKIEYIDEDMALSYLKLVVPYNPPSYAEVKAEYQSKGYKAVSSEATVDFQAETTAIEKSDPTLRRETDGDPTVQPRSISTRKLNVIGGSRWKTGAQSITWSFSVKETGLYKIAVRNQQNFNDGLPSYRQIAIDGVVPFEELEEYCFPYNRSWRLTELQSEDGEIFEFYLTEGEHTITMTVKYGPMTQVMESINDDTILLSSMIMDINKITGNDPDPNYDYEFFETIPDLKENMEALAASLQAKHDYLMEICSQRPAMASNFNTIISQLESMIKNPYGIAARIEELNTAQTNLGTYYLNLQAQQLTIDYFRVGAVSEVWKNEKASIFASLYTTFMNFLSSFYKDYDNVGGTLSEDVQIKETIEVWVARGTEWAEIIKEMADEDFTPKTGIAIKMNVVPSSQLSAGNVNAIMLSITSGKAPDVAVGVDATSPVDFAIRDAVVDLSKLSEWDEVKGRFIEEILVPYEYEGGVFAIPETMDFNVLFYRKDIMADLNLGVPNTREELYKYVLPVLYQNGYDFWYSKDFTQILYQHGGSFYTEDGYYSGLDTAEAYDAFVEYCELYTSYGCPTQADFYNRMRSGEIPIGIGNFSVYMKLSVAAPELSGKWGIAPLPGVLREDGTIDRSAGGLTGQGDIILSGTDKLESSWEFLKWWSSESVQTDFAREVEALQGAAARWNTANLAAFENLSWKEEDLNVLKEQWSWAKEKPNVLGGYFTDRYITNAWTTTVISGGDARDALEDAVKAINRELKMKQEEYGIFVE